MVGGKVRRKSTLLVLIVIVSLLLIFSFAAFADSCNSNKIALLGDSITNSYDKGGWGFEFKKRCGNLPVNYGHSGKWTEWMLNELKSDIIGKGHTHLIVTGGTNDIWNQKGGKGYTPTETIIGNLAQIYALAKQDGMKVIAGTIPPFTNQGGPQKNEQVKEINLWINSQLGTNVDQVVDFYSLLVGNEPCIKSEYEKNCNDVHPNTAGYQAMASKVVNEVFAGQAPAGPVITGQTAGTTFSNSASLQEFTTMIILGRHIRSQMENRVKGGLGLIIEGGNFNKLILTGGCAKQKPGSKDLTCPYDCSGGCKEADEMEEYLKILDPNFESRGITIIKEKKSGSTAANLAESKGFIQTGEKVLVVSDHRHVRPVAYCLRYSDPGADAYYHYIGISNAPEVPSINLVTEKPDDYYVKTIAKKCAVNYPPGQQQAAAPTTPTTSTPPIQRGGQPTAQSSTGQQTSPQQQQNQQQTTQQTTLQLRGLPKIQEEVDEVWFLKLGNAVRDSNLIWDYTLGTHANDWDWREFEEVYYEEVPVYTAPTGPQTYPPQPSGQPTPQPSPAGGTTALSSNLIGPTVWCTGNEGLPQPVYQDRIQKTAWYPSGSDTLYQLAVSVGNSKNVHPALLATHMVYESSMKKGEPGPKCTDDTGTPRSILTGCGWTGGPNGCAATPCGCKKKSTESDKTQLECTAAVDQSAYLQALGRKGETSCGSKCYYAKCDDYKNDPDKMWKCILCVYQGDYDRILPESSSTTYFTRDGTCKYAENFKKTYCSWVNYFAQQGASSVVTPPTPSTTVPTVPAGGDFRFVVFSDLHTRANEAKATKMVQSIIQLNPAFVIDDGDSVDGKRSDREKKWSQYFQNIAEPLINAGIPIFHVTGNHDTDKLNGISAEPYVNQVWEEFYSSNSAVYNKVQNFDYHNFPRQSFDYSGKKFILTRITGPGRANGELSYINGLVQPGSFIFGHSNIVNGLPFKDKYAGRALKYKDRLNFLKMLTEKNSIYVHGHMHVFYPMLFKAEGLQAKIVFVGTMGPELRYITQSKTKQPNSFVFFDVGSSVSVGSLLYDNGQFRQFTQTDVNKYFPNQAEIQSLQQANNFQQLPVGVAIT